MKKNLLLWPLLTLGAVLAPSLYLLRVWPRLPAQIPTRFGLDGHATASTSRDHAWLLALALPLGAALLLTALPHLDPKRRLDGGSANFQKLRLLLVALLSGLAGYALYVSVHPNQPAGRGVALLLGLFFAFLGNYLATVQPNYFVGIRTPWTLESPTVWARTHRVGGAFFFGAGLLLTVLALVLPLAWLAALERVVVLGGVAFCYGYSYLLFRREETAGHGA